MSETFTPYSELPHLLDKAIAKDSKICDELKKYIIEYADDYTSLKEKISKLAFDPLVFHDKDNQPDPKEFHSELFKEFPNVAVKCLLQVSSYEYAAHQIKKYANKKLGSYHEDYARRAGNIKKSFQTELENYEKAKKANEDARNAFNTAGCALRDAESKGVKDLAKLKQDFLSARKNAISVNQKAQTKAEACTQNMESLLTQIEELELWRSDELKSILLDFASMLENVAHHFVNTSSDMSETVMELPIENDSVIIADFSKIRPAQSDDSYQAWSVHTLTSKFLPKDQLYPKDVAKGGVQLFTVTEDFNGPAGFLACHGGEIVCGLKMEGEDYTCKNINESIGLIPKSILKPYE